MRQLSHFAVALVLFGTAVGTAFAVSATSYRTTVHLWDGKQAVCAVNEPTFAQQATMQTLTTRDRNEAEVIATARLRRLPNNRNNYPSPSSAPRVQCSWTRCARREESPDQPLVYDAGHPVLPYQYWL